MINMDKLRVKNRHMWKFELYNTCIFYLHELRFEPTWLLAWLILCMYVCVYIYKAIFPFDLWLRKPLNDMKQGRRQLWFILSSRVVDWTRLLHEWSSHHFFILKIIMPTCNEWPHHWGFLFLFSFLFFSYANFHTFYPYIVVTQTLTKNKLKIVSYLISFIKLENFLLHRKRIA